MRPLAVVSLIAVGAVAGVHGTRTPCWAGATTCLTGTAPEVGADLSQIAAVRVLIDTVCTCSKFDGTPRKTHASYVACAGSIINAQVSAGQLRTQCKGTVKKYYAASVCGVPASKGVVPCIKKTAAGRVSCSVEPSARCGGSGKTACPSFTTCIDAADTSGDGIIGAEDSAGCATPPAPTTSPTQTVVPTPTNTRLSPPTFTNTTTPSPSTNTPTTTSNTPTRTATAANTPTNTAARTHTPTPTPTSTPTPCTTGFADNGNGTITDCSTKLMWEKKDDSSGLHDKDLYFSWAGSCSVSGAHCQPDAASAAACAAATGSAYGCAQCEPTEGTCMVRFTGATIWTWVAQLNAANFAGHSDWRVPTSAGCCDAPTRQAAELESILSAQYPNCTASPCVSAVFNTNCTP